MLMPRVIPCLLLKNDGLVKTVRFSHPVYVGDPINAIKIFNEKEVDELIFLDITASSEKRRPRFDVLEKIASECFMPVCYGGGVRTIDDIRDILAVGIEKVSIGRHALEDPAFIKEAAGIFGSQSIVVCIDVKKNIFGRYTVVSCNGTMDSCKDVCDYVVEMAEAGAGELLINSVDRDGTMTGYDLALIKSVTSRVNIPVIACGGAGCLQDIADVIRQGGASCAAAGSLFVFHGKHKAVLIQYPEPKVFKELFQ